MDPIRLTGLNGRDLAADDCGVKVYTRAGLFRKETLDLEVAWSDIAEIKFVPQWGMSKACWIEVLPHGTKSLFELKLVDHSTQKNCVGFHRRQFSDVQQAALAITRYLQQRRRS
jgi:hypothetical protein